MGCRVIGVIVLFVLMLLDMVTILPATAKSIGSVEQIEIEDSRYPVVDNLSGMLSAERFQLKLGESYEKQLPLSVLNPEWLQQYSSPTGSRIIVEFMEIDIHKADRNYISAYSGSIGDDLIFGKHDYVKVPVTNPNTLLGALPLLFTSKNSRKRSIDVPPLQLVPNQYVSDGSVLTLYMKATQGTSHIVKVRLTTKMDPSAKSIQTRDLEQSSPVPTGNQNSFSICPQDGTQNTQRYTTYLSGTVSSHAEYPFKPMVPSKCSAEIEVPLGYELEFIADSIDLVTSEPSCDTASLTLTDINNGSQIKLCDKTHQGQSFTFSNRVRLEQMVGNFPRSAGAFIRYRAKRSVKPVPPPAEPLALPVPPLPVDHDTEHQAETTPVKTFPQPSQAHLKVSMQNPKPVIAMQYIAGIMLVLIISLAALVYLTKPEIPVSELNNSQSTPVSAQVSEQFSMEQTNLEIQQCSEYHVNCKVSTSTYRT